MVDVILVGELWLFINHRFLFFSLRFFRFCSVWFCRESDAFLRSNLRFSLFSLPQVSSDILKKWLLIAVLCEFCPARSLGL
jgi:hypothetical protein